MNVMLDFCVIPACISKSQNGTPYCSKYHQAYDRECRWMFARKYHYVILEDFDEDGPMFLSAWEKIPDCNQPEGLCCASPVVCVTSEQEQEVLQEEAERKRHEASEEEEEEEEEEVGGDEDDEATGSSEHPRSSVRGTYNHPTPTTTPSVPRLSFSSSLRILHSSHAREDVDEDDNADNDDSDDKEEEEDKVPRPERSLGHSSTLDELIEHDDNDTATADDGDEIDDDITEFSQTIREVGLVPVYLHKKMEMNDRLFNKMADSASGAPDMKATGYAKYNNQLALSVNPRQSNSTQSQRRLQLSGELSLSKRNGGGSSNSNSSNSGSSQGIQRSGVGRAATERLSPRGLMSPPESTSAAAVRRRTHNSRTGSGNNNDHNHNGSRNSSIGYKPSSTSSLTGLAWSDGYFHKVSLAAVNKEYTKKKRPIQTQLNLESHKRNKRPC